MFNPAAAFRPDPDRSPQWNRGAYLAEAMAHCGECHTPRNLGFALDNRHKFAGATTNGWRAFNISADKETGIGGWTDEDRKSVVEGKRVSVRVELGGRRIIKKKKRNNA